MQHKSPQNRKTELSVKLHPYLSHSGWTRVTSTRVPHACLISILSVGSQLLQTNLHRGLISYEIYTFKIDIYHAQTLIRIDGLSNGKAF